MSPKMKIEYGPEWAEACGEAQDNQEGCYMYLEREQQNNAWCWRPMASY